MPATSVVIPVRNRADFIGRAVRSALRQTLPPVEVVVVDDGSTDDTVEVVEALGDSRVRIVSHKHSLGGAAARNSGLETTSADVVAFLDSDDEWTPDRLERQVTEEARAGLLACGFVVHRPDRVVRAAPGCFRGSDPYRRLLRLRGGPLTSSCLILDRRRAGDMRFDPTLPALQDLDFAIRVVDVAGLAFVRRPLTRKFSGHGERVFTPKNEIPARRLLMERHEPALKADGPALGAHHLALARALAGDSSVARDEVEHHLRAAAEAWPSMPVRAARGAWERRGAGGLRLACQAWWFLAEDPGGRVRGAVAEGVRPR